MVSINKHSWIPVDIFTYSPIVRLGPGIALMGAFPREFHGYITLSLFKFLYDSIRPHIIGNRPSAGVPWSSSNPLDCQWLSNTYNGLSPNWDILTACSNDQGKCLQIMTLIIIIVMAPFQDTPRILLFSHDGSSLSQKLLLGATFLGSLFYDHIESQSN